MGLVITFILMVILAIFLLFDNGPHAKEVKNAGMLISMILFMVALVFAIKEIFE